MHFAVPVVFLATRAGAVATAARPALESLVALEKVAALEERHEKLSQRIQQVVERAGPATSRAQNGHREQKVQAAEAVVDAEASLAPAAEAPAAEAPAAEAPAADSGSSFAELEQKAQLVAQLAAGNPLFCFGRLGGYICMMLAGCALFAYIGRVCFGEKSCWYTWPICQKIRLALNMDTGPAFGLQCTVHRARDIAPGSTLFVAVFSRRTGKKAPKMPSGTVPKTADSQDYKWEQALSVQVAQGAEEVCFCVFSAGAIRSATLIGYDTVSVESLLDKDAEKIDKKWIYLKDGKDTPAGGLQITILKPQLPGKKGAKGASAAAAAAAMTLDTAVPNVAGMDTEETLTEYQKALCGPLNVASRNGEYTLRYFNVERKRDVWIWSWYKGGKKPGPSAKPLGRIPLMSISTIYEVPNSISEFIVRYRDATDSGVDMMLQRHDRPRENWVKTLHAMLALIRDLRKQGESGQAKKTKKAKKEHSLKKSKSKQITESSEAASDSGSVAVDSDSD